MQHEIRAPSLDIQAFAESARSRSGRDLLSNYERLIEETQGLGPDNPVEWSVQGALRADQTGASQAWLHLNLAACLPLTCQRCLGPVEQSLAIDRWFRFVETEALAEAQDDEAEEDVLVTSRQFNLAGLIEDELLMALPLVPRHDVCPTAIKMAVADPGFDQHVPEKAHPFAALAKLRRGETD